MERGSESLARNEKRMLQDAVGLVLDNGRSGKRDRRHKRSAENRWLKWIKGRAAAFVRTCWASASTIGPFGNRGGPQRHTATVRSAEGPVARVGNWASHSSSTSGTDWAWLTHDQAALKVVEIRNQGLGHTGRRDPLKTDHADRVHRR